jgi:hypothetical protein
MGDVSAPSAWSGCIAASQMVHGHAAAVIVTGTPALGASMLPLSSTARLFTVIVPSALGRHA